MRGTQAAVYLSHADNLHSLARPAMQLLHLPVMNHWHGARAEHRLLKVRRGLFGRGHAELEWRQAVVHICALRPSSQERKHGLAWATLQTQRAAAVGGHGGLRANARDGADTCAPPTAKLQRRQRRQCGTDNEGRMQRTVPLCVYRKWLWRWDGSSSGNAAGARGAPRGLKYSCPYRTTICCMDRS